MTAWVSLTASVADDPVDTDLADALVNRDLHLREFLTGSSERYLARIPHDHSGDGNDLALSGVSGPNLILNPCPEGKDEHWAGTSNSFSSTFSTVALGNTSGDHLYQILAKDDETGNTNHAVFGSGTPLVLSFVCKAWDALSAGVMHFGISDGSTTTFTTGNRFTLDHSQVSSTLWRRFWMRADLTSNSPPSGTALPGDSHATDVRFLMRASTVFTQDLLLTGFMACQSDGVLTPFNWGPHEHSAEGYGRVHGEHRQPKAPIWSTAVGMDNAVELTVRA